MRKTGSPSDSTARSQRRRHSGALGAAAARIVSSILKCRPRRAQIDFSSASTSLASASRASLVVARRSRLKLQRPGTTLIEPLGTFSMPMVPTTSGTPAARRSTNCASSATATAASRRRFIGVVPA